LHYGGFVDHSNLTRANAPGKCSSEKGRGHLSKACVVNVSQILTVDKTELAHSIGKLTAASKCAVRDGLHLLFDRLWKRGVSFRRTLSALSTTSVHRFFLWVPV